MKKRRFITLIVLLAAALLLPAMPALADEGPPGDGVIIWDEDYTVEEGETLNGDLVVFNGDVTIEDGGRVEGSVVIWNGSADVYGTVEGDLVVSAATSTWAKTRWWKGTSCARRTVTSSERLEPE